MEKEIVMTITQQAIHELKLEDCEYTLSFPSDGRTLATKYKSVPFEEIKKWYVLGSELEKTNVDKLQPGCMMVDRVTHDIYKLLDVFPDHFELIRVMEITAEGEWKFFTN